MAEWLEHSDIVPLLRIGEQVRFPSIPSRCEPKCQNPIVCLGLGDLIGRAPNSEPEGQASKLAWRNTAMYVNGI